MTQITALASAILLPARLSFQPRHGVVARGGKQPTQRAIHASNGPRGNGMDSAHSLSDTIMDLSRFISGGVKHKGICDDLAQSIGKEIYVDVQGWHVYLKDIQMDTDTTMDQALASQLGPLAQPSQELTECVLKGLSLDMGEGKLSVPLYDAIPMKGIQNLAKIITAYNKQ